MADELENSPGAESGNESSSQPTTNQSATRTQSESDELGAKGKKALEAERAARAALEQQLKAFGGVKPEEIQELLKLKQEMTQKQKDEERQKLEAKGQYDALLLKAQQEHEKQQKALQEQLNHKDSLIAELQKQTQDLELSYKNLGIQHAAQAAFFANKGKRGDSTEGDNFYFDFLWSKVGAYIKPGEKGPEIVDGSGNLILDENKKPYTVPGFIAAQKEKFPALFDRDSEASGGGKPPGSNSRKLVEADQKPTVKRSELKDIRGWAKAHGMTAEKAFDAIGDGSITVVDD